MQLKTLAILCAISGSFACNSWAMQNDEDFIGENRSRIHQQMKMPEFQNDDLETQELSYFQTALNTGSKGIKFVLKHPITSVMIGLFMQATMVEAGHGQGHG